MHVCPIKGMARYLSWGREGKQEHIGIVAEIKKKTTTPEQKCDLDLK